MPGRPLVSLTVAARERWLSCLLVRPQEERSATVAADAAVVSAKLLVVSWLQTTNWTNLFPRASVALHHDIV